MMRFRIPAVFVVFVFVLVFSGCITKSGNIFGFKVAKQIQSELDEQGKTDLDITFAYDSADLTDAAKKQITEFAKAVKKLDLSKKAILIVGNTDSKGPAQYNQDLSLERAFSVMTELINVHGLSPDTIRWEGRGESNPVISPERSEKDRQRNRRVEIQLIDVVKS